MEMEDSNPDDSASGELIPVLVSLTITKMVSCFVFEKRSHRLAHAVLKFLGIGSPPASDSQVSRI